MKRLLSLVCAVIAIAAALTGAAALLASNVSGVALAAETLQAVGCTDGRGGVTTVDVTPVHTAGDPNCRSLDPRRQELCARKVCQSLGADSTPVWWQ